MYRLIILLSLLATVSQALPTNATTRMATEGYVTNRVALGVASRVATNDAPYLATVAKAGTAWQNLASITDWTYTSNGRQITLTGYTGTNLHVIVPDMINGLPVTDLVDGVLGMPGPQGTVFGNTLITSVDLRNIRRIGLGSFYNCRNLQSVLAPALTNIGFAAFNLCTNLVTLDLPAVTVTGEGALSSCYRLSAVYFSAAAAPLNPVNVFQWSTNVTVYVRNPTATGWDTTFSGRPVVRMGGTFDSLALDGTTRTAWPVGTTNHNDLVGRTLADAHPPSAITGLDSSLARIPPSVLTNQLWGAVGTNATYRMSWDVTNGTFKVEEILP